MPSRHRFSRRWAVLFTSLTLAAPVLATGCSSSNASAGSAGTSTGKPSASSTQVTATTPPAKGPAPAPKAKTCRNLSYGDINRFSNDSPIQSCDKTHTGFTFAVEQLPKDISFKGVDIGNDAVQEKAALLCRADFATYIGGSSATRALSRLSVTYFLPTQPDFDLGSRWVRCDVIALQSTRVLAALPPQLRGFNATAGALDAYGVCSQGDPGATGTVLVMCNQTHTYRALTVLRLGSDSAAYPGNTVVGTDGQRRCAAYMAHKFGSGGGYSYAWTYPSSQDWTKGQRFGFCWNRTSH